MGTSAIVESLRDQLAETMRENTRLHQEIKDLGKRYQKEVDTLQEFLDYAHIEIGNLETEIKSDIKISEYMVPVVTAADDLVFPKRDGQICNWEPELLFEPDDLISVSRTQYEVLMRAIQTLNKFVERYQKDAPNTTPEGELVR